MIKLTWEAIGVHRSVANIDRPGVDYDLYLGEDSIVPTPLKRALQTYKDVEALPSCIKMATSTLLHSCGALDNAGTSDFMKDADFSLDQSKSIYATRMAVCEISEARVPVPGQCASFVPSEQNSRKKGFMGRFTGQGTSKPTINYPVYESSTEHNLDDCRTALENRPQWWTSYSNARQNAVALCHAVRGALEKDEAIHLHKVLAETTVDVSGALQEAKADVAVIKAAFHDLVTQVHEFHLDLVNDDQTRQDEVRRLWAGWMEQMGLGVDGLADRISEINTNLRDTGAEVANSGKQAVGTIKEIMETVNGMVTQHSKNVAFVSKDADIAHERIQYLNELLEQQITQQIYAWTKNLETSNSLAATVQHNLERIDLSAAGSTELVVAIGTQLAIMSEQIHGLTNAHDEMRETVNGTMAVVSELKEEVEATRSAMAAITGFFTSLTNVLGRVPSIIWFLFWTGFLVALLGLICACPGGPTLLLMAGSLIVRVLRWTLSHSFEVFGAALVLVYFTAIESPLQLIRRWQAFGISTFEQVFAGVYAGIVIGSWAVVFLGRRFGEHWHQDELDYEFAVESAAKEAEIQGLLGVLQEKRRGIAGWWQARTEKEGELAI